MNRSFGLIATIAAVAALTIPPAAQSTTPASTRQPAARMRIGVFDSRCVALAYDNSPAFQNELKQLRTDLEAANAAKDTRTVDALTFQGPAIQSLLHYQVFSNASIPNVLDQLRAVLPKVAADARVSLIVSKWDVAFKNAEADYVDVTDALVRAFIPSASVLQMIEATKAQTPMDLLQAVKTLRPDR